MVSSNEECHEEMLLYTVIKVCLLFTLIMQCMIVHDARIRLLVPQTIGFGPTNICTNSHNGSFDKEEVGIMLSTQKSKINL